MRDYLHHITIGVAIVLLALLTLSYLGADQRYTSYYQRSVTSPVVVSTKE